MSDESEVGSLAEEAFRLLSAFGQADGETHVTCPHAWCPLCRLMDYLMSHPEMMDEASEALGKVTASISELVKTLHPDMTRE